MRELGLDEAFLRMWDFYLCYCEGGFEQRQPPREGGGTNVKRANRLGSIELTSDLGRRVRLDTLWQDRPVVLVFLRHFG